MENQPVTEDLFRRQLLALISTAKKQGMCVTDEQVKAAFPGMELTDSKIELIHEYLKNSKITVGDTPDYEELLTQEDRNYLEDYKRELEELPKYSKREKEQIIIEAFGGDRLAKEKLLQLFLPQVVELSKLYTGQGVLVEDLIGEGNVALTMAMEMFDCIERPDEMEGFLSKMVMDAMEQSIEVELSESQQDQEIVDKVNMIAKAARELAEDLRRPVTISELAKETEFCEEEMKEVLSITGYKIEDIDREAE